MSKTRHWTFVLLKGLVWVIIFYLLAYAFGLDSKDWRIFALCMLTSIADNILDRIMPTEEARS